MQLSNFEQLNLFLVFVIVGIISGILFDVFRILRLTFKTSDFITYIEDILFLILIAIVLVYVLFFYANGDIRFYYFVGIMLGCLSYYFFISKYIVKLGTAILKVIKKYLKIIYNILTYPIKLIFKGILKVFPEKFIFRFFNLRDIFKLKKNAKKSVK